MSQLRTTAAQLAVLLALSAGGLTAIKQYEGTVKDPAGAHMAYTDTGGVVTICYGHTDTAQLGQKRSESECISLLKKDIAWAEAAVKRAVIVPIVQHQYDSLVSLTFNIGAASFQNSTLVRKLNAGDCLGAGAQFSRWVYDNGKQNAGLVNRRAAERNTFEKGCVK